ncbi:hypothetical protein H4I95_09764 [Botrytis cinerea]
MHITLTTPLPLSFTIFQNHKQYHRHFSSFVSIVTILTFLVAIFLNYRSDYKDLIDCYESVYVVIMNQQNEPLLTVHDLLAREVPSLRRANLPLIHRAITYVVAVRELMVRFYIDEPVYLLIKWNHTFDGDIKPSFWQALATILLTQQILAQSFLLFACRFFMHIIICIPILFIPTSYKQGYENISYFCSWIFTIALLPCSVCATREEWRLLVEDIEGAIEDVANGD